MIFIEREFAAFFFTNVIASSSENHLQNRYSLRQSLQNDSEIHQKVARVFLPQDIPKIWYWWHDQQS